jgi:hypothetical protein
LIIKHKNLLKDIFFITFCALSEAKGMIIIMKNFKGYFATGIFDIHEVKKYLGKLQTNTVNSNQVKFITSIGIIEATRKELLSVHSEISILENNIRGSSTSNYVAEKRYQLDSDNDDMIFLKDVTVTSLYNKAKIEFDELILMIDQIIGIVL